MKPKRYKNKLNLYFISLKVNLTRKTARKYFLVSMLLVTQTAFAQETTKGIRGNSKAISDAQSMVETMGGIEIWKQIKSLHFVHEWYPVNRIDTYVENEIIDLVDPRSWVNRKSEFNHTIRAYSPKGKYWTEKNGVLEYANDKIWKAALKRAPFNFYHLVRAVAINDSFYEIKYGKSDIPYSKQLDFFDPQGVLRGWVILNVKNEPIVKATPEYRYTLGPLTRFGNLWVPRWGVYDTGFTRYEMISLVGSNQPADSSLFLPPIKSLSETESR